MRKHEVSYHEKIDIIEFILEFCTHSKEIETNLTRIDLMNKKKRFLSKKKVFKVNQNTSNLTFSLRTRENSR